VIRRPHPRHGVPLSEYNMLCRPNSSGNKPPAAVICVQSRSSANSLDRAGKCALIEELTPINTWLGPIGNVKDGVCTGADWGAGLQFTIRVVMPLTINHVGRCKWMGNPMVCGIGICVPDKRHTLDRPNTVPSILLI
jgi:hypothetical protein